MNVAEKRVLKTIDGNDGNPTLEVLQKTEGIGLAKANLIAAALEFARRRIRPEGLRISFPADCLPLIRHLCRTANRNISSAFQSTARTR